jgi:hypothetical protein
MPNEKCFSMIMDFVTIPIPGYFFLYRIIPFDSSLLFPNINYYLDLVKQNGLVFVTDKNKQKRSGPLD